MNDPVRILPGLGICLNEGAPDTLYTWARLAEAAFRLGGIKPQSCNRIGEGSGQAAGNKAARVIQPGHLSSGQRTTEFYQISQIWLSGGVMALPSCPLAPSATNGPMRLPNRLRKRLRYGFRKEFTAISGLPDSNPVQPITSARTHSFPARPFIGQEAVRSRSTAPVPEVPSWLYVILHQQFHFSPFSP